MAYNITCQQLLWRFRKNLDRIFRILFLNCTGLSSGFSIPVAQKFGARDEKELRRFVINPCVCCLYEKIMPRVIVFCTHEELYLST